MVIVGRADRLYSRSLLIGEITERTDRLLRDDARKSTFARTGL
jgi:hypothetical protein